LQVKLLLGERIIYLLRMCLKQELGNEGKAGCAALSRPTDFGLLMKSLVGRASPPAIQLD
jgi:hypothetical protein